MRGPSGPMMGPKSGGGEPDPWAHLIKKSGQSSAKLDVSSVKGGSGNFVPHVTGSELANDSLHGKSPGGVIRV